VVVVRLVLALVRSVHRDRALDEVQHQEAGRERHHDGRHAQEDGIRQVEQLGQQVEGDQAEHDPGGEPEDQVQPVPAAQRHHAAQPVDKTAARAKRTGIRRA
jgi:hypothetical protein